jgi:hypothetical protein
MIQEMKETALSIKFLIDRVRDVQREFGTITNKLTLQTAFETTICPDIFPPDLLLFRQIVERGVMEAADLRPPTGYKVLDFLTMLHHLQEQKRNRDDKEQRAELNNLYKLHK